MTSLGEEENNPDWSMDSSAWSSSLGPKWAAVTEQPTQRKP